MGRTALAKHVSGGTPDTAWVLRFKTNHLAKLKKINDIGWKTTQKGIPNGVERPAWKLVKDNEANLLKCTGRIQGYKPAYIEDGPLTQKLIQHVHAQIKHLGVANTMAALREEWRIPWLRTLVKKETHNCNVSKVFATKPYGSIARRSRGRLMC